MDEQLVVRGRGGPRLIAIGASSGGVEALLEVIPQLPAGLAAAVCIVLHTSPNARSKLPQILGRRAALPVAHAVDGTTILPGHVYVAPPDRHLLVEAGRLLVTRGPRENRHRPAVDTLFRSAALAYGPRAIGVILSGALDDGSAGLLAIKRRGGVAIVQDPAEALFSGMPASALQHVAVDRCLRLAEIAPALARLVREPVGEGMYTVPPEMELEHRYARAEAITPERDGSVGQPTSVTCPECHGPLWEIRDASLIRFRCRTGHAFTAESMLAEQADALEGALWLAVNTLEEGALVAERLGREATERQHHHVAARFAARVHESRRRAATIRTVIANVEPESPDEEDAALGAAVLELAGGA